MNPAKGSRRPAAILQIWRDRMAATMATSEIWRGFRKEFDELAQGQTDLIGDRSRSDLTLRAYCSYGDEHPAFGVIRIGGGATPRLRSEFEDIATRAGIALGCPPRVRPADYWVHVLCQDLIKSDSAELFARSAAGGIIQGLIESSASYCVRLATAADEEAHRTTVSAANITTALPFGLILSDAEKDAIAEAEDCLAASLQARDQMRGLLRPDGWVRVSPQGPSEPSEPTLVEDFRTLERDIEEYATKILDVIAGAAWKLARVDQFSECLRICGTGIRELATTKIDSQDLLRFDPSKLDAAVQRKIDSWVREAKLKLQPPGIAASAIQPDTRTGPSAELSDSRCDKASPPNQNGSGEQTADPEVHVDKSNIQMDIPKIATVLVQIDHHSGNAREALAMEVRRLETAETDWFGYTPAFERYVVERFCELWDAGWRPGDSRWVDEFLDGVLGVPHTEVSEPGQHPCLWGEFVTSANTTAMNDAGKRRVMTRSLENALWQVYVYRPTFWESGETSPDGVWPHLQTPAFWLSLRGDFDALEVRLRSVLTVPNRGLEHPEGLRASCSYAEVERCRFAGGRDQRWVSDFVEVATRAGCGLGCPPGLDPAKFWICCLGRDLLTSDNEHLKKALVSTGFVRSGVIPDLIGSSGAFCSRLAAWASSQLNEQQFPPKREQLVAQPPNPTAGTAKPDLSADGLDKGSSQVHPGTGIPEHSNDESSISNRNSSKDGFTGEGANDAVAQPPNSPLKSTALADPEQTILEAGETGKQTEAAAARIARAETVGKLITELNRLKPQMFEDEAEYNVLRGRYADFLTFKIADERRDLKRKVLAIQGSTRHIMLAQELAAAHYGRALSTIRDDWKDHKPSDFRRQP